MVQNSVAIARSDRPRHHHDIHIRRIGIVVPVFYRQHIELVGRNDILRHRALGVRH